MLLTNDYMTQRRFAPIGEFQQTMAILSSIGYLYHNKRITSTVQRDLFPAATLLADATKAHRNRVWLKCLTQNELSFLPPFSLLLLLLAGLAPPVYVCESDFPLPFPSVPGATVVRFSHPSVACPFTQSTCAILAPHRRRLRCLLSPIRHFPFPSPCRY